jgi:hypothetical protein
MRITRLGDAAGSPRCIDASRCNPWGISALVFSGKTERFDDQPDQLFVRADSARC